LKIAIVAHAFPPYVGGLAYVVENLSVNLAKMGFEVEVLTLDVGMGLPKYEEYKGVHVRRFKGYAPDDCYYIPSIEFIEYFKKVKADVVHVHNIGSLLTPIATHIVRKRIGSKIVVTPHYHESGSKWHTKIAWFTYKPIAKYFLQRAEVLHAVSEYEASLLKRDFKLEAVVIPNGVSEDVFNYEWNPPRDRVVLTYAGRVERYKKLDLVLRVIQELKRHGINATFRIIGEGPDLPRVRKMAEHMKVGLEALGFLPREEYLKELSTSTALVNLSDYEAYSIVTAEALAMRVPAITAEPWGRTFEGVSGAYIVNKYNIREVVDVVTRVYNSINNPAYKADEKRLSVNEKILPWHQVAEQIVQKLYL